MENTEKAYVFGEIDGGIRSVLWTCQQDTAFTFECIFYLQGRYDIRQINKRYSVYGVRWRGAKNRWQYSPLSAGCKNRRVSHSKAS